VFKLNYFTLEAFFNRSMQNHLKHFRFTAIISFLLIYHIACASAILPHKSKYAPLKGKYFMSHGLLKMDSILPLINQFRQEDASDMNGSISDKDAAEWMNKNIPFFDCPDKKIEQIYYFRWWSYRKHLKMTPDGYIVTEFLPDVPWAGKDNSISCAAGHHFYEGRWIRDPRYLNDYSVFWFRKGGDPRNYSFWAADALYARYLVNGDRDFLVGLLPDLIKNWEAWRSTNYTPEIGLYHQVDDRDGMEISIGGSGYRPTINSYEYGDAEAIARIADMAGKPDLAREYRGYAEEIKQKVQSILWNPEQKFFEVSPDGKSLSNVRELIGYTPWCFNMPDNGYEAAWKQLSDPNGFYAPFGPTTAERRSPRFMFQYPHDCLWNGPSWPYATSQTLTALANLLNNYQQDVMMKKNFYELMEDYTRSQYRDGHPWIAEDLNGITGKWIVDLPRSVYYNHSTYCDNVITGLVGLRPRADSIVEINPLLPDDAWNYFCLDHVTYHGHELTILYDKSGKRYGKGAGLRVYADGELIIHCSKLQHCTGRLPGSPALEDTNGGWVKNTLSPVLGGSLGTCFDCSLLKEQDLYKMWFSWRPKKSIALTESSDGIHWSQPIITLPPEAGTGWEDDINRPAVIQLPDGYHLWYTGQAHGKSWIGYAVSPDGINWKRMSDKPVLSPTLTWEKAAVMCPDVIWDSKKKVFRMWYSGGDQYEPDAIGYAQSADGLHWVKKSEPVFMADKEREWEQYKVRENAYQRQSQS
jgi:hypothetical protein